jgi:uncharacterized protein (TIGR02594 family)
MNEDQLTRKALLDTAFKYLGEKEVDGPGSNPLIVKWFQNWGAGWQTDDSRLAWCSVFMNQICNESGVVFSGLLNARSWLKEGEETNDPKPGDFVIFWRGKIDGWQGHIALYIREDENFVWCLGGNQGNQVQISKYAKERVLGYRIPIAAE